MRYLTRALVILVAVPLGLIGLLMAAGSILSACGVPLGTFLYTPQGLIIQFFSYCGWMIGGIIALASYVAIIWATKGPQGVQQFFDRLPRSRSEF